MRKLAIALAMWLAILVSSAASSAVISDDDYEFFMTREDFAASDNALNDAWKKAKATLPPNVYRIVLDDQRKWVNTERETLVVALTKLYPFMDDCTKYMIANFSRAVMLDMFTNFANSSKFLSDAELTADFLKINYPEFVGEFLASVDIAKLNPYNIGGRFRSTTGGKKAVISAQIKEMLDKAQRDLKSLQQ